MNLRALVILFSFSFFGQLIGNETGHKIELLTQTGNYSDELIVEYFLIFFKKGVLVFLFSLHFLLFCRGKLRGFLLLFFLFIFFAHNYSSDVVIE